MIYLDNNATTRVLPEVLEVMLPFYTEFWGNPSSLHPFGARIAPHIDKAREKVAGLIGAQRGSEITFTSGGTESNHLALRGVLAAHPEKRHIVTTAVEHSSILMLCDPLQKEGYEITFLNVDENGNVDLEEVKKSIRPETALVSILWANNETGVIFPIDAISKICAEKKVPFHTDAIQAVGKIPIDLKKTEVDLLSISGHKFHAPKGIGALYIRRGTKWMPQTFGGHQERGRRAGTENVTGIIGLGKAAELAYLRLEDKSWEKIGALRNHLEQKLSALSLNFLINGKNSKRLPNTSSLSFAGQNGETMCLLLGEADIAASTGSACSAGSLEPSHVLKAMQANSKQARGTIRISLSADTTVAEINSATECIEKIIRRLKKN